MSHIKLAIKPQVPRKQTLYHFHTPHGWPQIPDETNGIHNKGPCRTTSGSATALLNSLGFEMLKSGTSMLPKTSEPMSEVKVSQ